MLIVSKLSRISLLVLCIFEDDVRFKSSETAIMAPAAIKKPLITEFIVLPPFSFVISIIVFFADQKNYLLIKCIFNAMI
jgi:GR25 family glycosyltransferase involved in LPS biosynthesis